MVHLFVLRHIRTFVWCSVNKHTSQSVCLVLITASLPLFIFEYSHVSSVHTVNTEHVRIYLQFQKKPFKNSRTCNFIFIILIVRNLNQQEERISKSRSVKEPAVSPHVTRWFGSDQHCSQQLLTSHPDSEQPDRHVDSHHMF